jgi:hypothetical protein
MVYASEQAHSSVDKAMIALGLGLDNLRHIGVDKDFRMDVDALERALAEDKAAGRRPLAIVATGGTTSTTAVDPIPEIAEICRREVIWLHVDAAYAGSAAVCPEYRSLLRGWELGDSIVMNPHKWLFTPVDCSLLYVRDPAVLRGAFSLTPEYPQDSGAGRDESDGLGSPARTKIPIAEALDGHPLVWSHRDSGSNPNTLRLCPRLCGLGRGGSGLRALRAGPVQHGLLSSDRRAKP